MGYAGTRSGKHFSRKDSGPSSGFDRVYIKRRPHGQSGPAHAARFLNSPSPSPCQTSEPSMKLRAHLETIPHYPDHVQQGLRFALAPIFLVRRLRTPDVSRELEYRRTHDDASHRNSDSAISQNIQQLTFCVRCIPSRFSGP